jgi:hypothetical protein
VAWWVWRGVVWFTHLLFLRANLHLVLKTTSVKNSQQLTPTLTPTPKSKESDDDEPRKCIEQTNVKLPATYLPARDIEKCANKQGCPKGAGGGALTIKHKKM